MNITDQGGLGRLAIETLDRLEIPYMVTGSVASFLYGEIRATNDLDVVIAPTLESLNALVDVLERHAHVTREAALEAFQRTSMFNVIGNGTGEKVDFILFKDRTYGRTAFERRTRMAFKSLPLTVSTAEDSILSKLSWARRGGSDMQLRDVYGMLRNKELQLDWDYLKYWAPELGVVALLEQLLSDLEKDSTIY